MAIKSTQKQSDLEKRFSKIQSQFYGKETLKLSTPTFTISQEIPTQKNISKVSNSSEINFLYYDLKKILLLSVLVFAAQAGLYYLLINNLINLNNLF